MRARTGRTLAASGFLVLTSLLFQACAPQPTPQPTPLPTPTPMGGGGLIAFASNRNGNYDLYVIKPDGYGEKQLTSEPTNELSGDFSPNGEFFVYWVSDTSNQSSSYALWLLKLEDLQHSKWGPGYGKTSWSADGEQVLFNYQGNIVGVSLDGKTIHRYTTDGKSNTTPDISPDGKMIAYTSHRVPTAHIYLINSDGTNDHRLTNLDVAEFGANWSPDGKQIAFWVMLGTGHSQVYIVNSDGTGLQKLTDTKSLNDGAYFSPDGKMIIFSSNRSGNRELYLMNIDGSGLEQITHYSSEELNPAWSPFSH